MDLNQVTVSVTDISRSVNFYRQLGLNLIVDSPHYARFSCPQGSSTFSVHVAETVEPGTTTIYFECENLDETVGRLKGSGLAFDSDPVDQPWLWREAHLRDPDGHRICLFSGGENRVNPPWRIDKA